MADKTGFEPAYPKTLALKASALDLTLLLIRMVLSWGFEPQSLGRKPCMIGHYTTRAMVPMAGFEPAHSPLRGERFRHCPTSALSI